MSSDIGCAIDWLNTEISFDELKAGTKTKWCVITGGPYAGKSTVVNVLENRGFSVVSEVALWYIKEQLSTGRSIKEITADQLRFQRTLLNLMFDIEQKLDHDSTIFLDRALPDGIGFYREAGLDPLEVFKICNVHRYSKIFLLELIPEGIVKRDGIRLEDEEKAKRLEHEIEAGYRELGYEVIRVPFMPVIERVSFILDFVIPKEKI
jgi:predicted ATPase